MESATPNGQNKADELGPGRQDFYQESADRFSTWVQFEEAKAGGVLVLLGLGLTDVLGNADTLIHAYHDSPLGWVATVGFSVAIVAAVATVVTIGRAIWPNTKSKRESIFYFYDVADKYPEFEDYRDAVVATKDPELEDDMARQAFKLAAIAAKKVRYIKQGFWSVAIFLGAWAIARIALGLG